MHWLESHANRFGVSLLRKDNTRWKYYNRATNNNILIKHKHTFCIHSCCDFHVDRDCIGNCEIFSELCQVYRIGLSFTKWPCSDFATDINSFSYKTEKINHFCDYLSQNFKPWTTMSYTVCATTQLFKR